MSERSWQNADYFEDNFLDICQEACAISDPDGVIETPDSSAMDTNIWKRSAMFRDLRRIYADTPEEIHGYHELGWVPVGEDKSTTELFDRARECAARIVGGECSRFVYIHDPQIGKERMMSITAARKLGLIE